MANSTNHFDRIVVLVDMDCFYCQVEEKLNPDLTGKPLAVVQYNAWKGGGIIAVNYPARDRGVTRHMRGDEAKEHCPDIELVRVPNIREKADLSKYRDAGKRVAAVLQTFTPLLERASVDEAYLDITANVVARIKQLNEGTFTLSPDKLAGTYAVGYDTINEFVQNISAEMKMKAAGGGGERPSVAVDAAVAEERLYNRNEINLLIGASIANEIRAAVKEQTGYDCSAGLAHNKILAKLVCGLNKPNKQTVLPVRHIGMLYNTLSVKKIRGLGGKFGEDVCDLLKIKVMEELASFTQEELMQKFDEKNGLWLYNIGRGIDTEPVTPRFASKSIGCCKKFPGRNAIRGMATLLHWFGELAQEIYERIEQDECENNRRPRQMVVSYTIEVNAEDVPSSRSIPLPATSVTVERLAADAMDTLKRNVPGMCATEKGSIVPIKFLGLSVGKFEDLDLKPKNTIESMFTNQEKINAEKRDEHQQQPTETPNDESTVNNPKKSFFGNKVAIKTSNESVPATSSPKKGFFSNHKRLSDNSNASSTSSLNGSADASLITNSTINQSDYEIGESSASFAAPAVVLVSPPVEDYRSTYAEFQSVPARQPPPIYEKCSQCNKNVLAADMQSHSDAHFAFQLSQEQRVEFRSQMKQRMTPPAASSQAKRPRLDRNTEKQQTVGALNLIKKFLLKSPTTTTTTTDDEGSHKCPECGSRIALDRLDEHADYHTAKRLQIELNQSSMPTVRTNGQPQITKGAKGTAKSNNRSQQSSQQPLKANTTSVAKFFKQGN